MDAELSAHRREPLVPLSPNAQAAPAVSPIARTGRMSERGGHMMGKMRRRLNADDGMTTAEYAVGTVAACGFAGTLLQLLGSDWVQDLLKSAISSAFDLIF